MNCIKLIHEKVKRFISFEEVWLLVVEYCGYMY